MAGLLAQIAPEYVGENMPPFVQGVRYYADMDYLVYMQEPTSYRADRVDELLTVLWHPVADRLVGIKLKGWRHFFNEMKTQLELSDSDFFPIIKALEFGMAEVLARSLMENIETVPPSARYRKAERYAKAILLTHDVRVPTREWSDCHHERLSS